MKKIIIITLTIIFNTFSAFSIFPIVRNFTRNDYKSGSQNWDITQNESKCMYFANNNGLLEFDGTNWTTYPIANFTIVRSVMYDSVSQRIYAGATNEFGYYELNLNGKMQYHSLIKKCPPNLNVDEIWNIYKKDNVIYFQTNSTIFEYKNEKIKVHKFKYKINCSAIINNSLIVATQEEGAVLLSGDMFVKLSNSEVLLNKRVCAILPYKDGKFFFVTDVDGLYLYDGLTIMRYKTDIDDFIIKNQVFCAAINGDQIALGTVSNGVVLKNIGNNSTIYANTLSGLKNNTILSLYFDLDHNLWLGLDKGIDYALINSPEYSLFGTENLYGTGYSSLVDDRKLYLATNQGLYYMNYPLTNSSSPSTVLQVDNMQGQVWNVNKIHNTIFCASDRGGFILKNGKAEKIERIKQGVWKFIELRKHPNYVLGCAYDGLFILKNIDDKWKFTNYIKGFEESSIAFEEDNDGSIWLSHWTNGLYRIIFNNTLDSVLNIEQFNNKKDFPTKRNNVPYRVDDNIVFSSEGGFFKYDEHLRKMKPFIQLNSLFKETPITMRIHETPSKDLIFISGVFQGIAFRNENKTYTIDSISLNYLRNKLIIGFESLNFIDKDNILCSTIDGFSWINFDKIKNNNHRNDKHSIFIKNVYSTNNKDSLLYSQRTSLANKKGDKHKFLFSDNSLRIEFVSPEFRGENSTTYSYYLENYDKSWSDYSSTTIKEYTQLASGTYIFHVKAKNRFYANIIEDSYMFEILPPWYLSKAAHCVYLLFSITCIWMIINLIDKRSKQRAKRIETSKNIEIEEREKLHEEDSRKKEQEIVVLKNKTLEYSLKLKNQELANSTLNLIQKKEILLKIRDDINKISPAISERPELIKVSRQLNKIKNDIRENIEHDNDWAKFEENFDFVYEDYLKRLSKQFPQLNIGDKKLCAYLRMDLSSKNIAPLMNISVRSVEMARYRLRKKMELNRDINLADFLQNF